MRPPPPPLPLPPPIPLAQLLLLTSPQNDILMPESCDMVVESVASPPDNASSLDTAPVYGQVGVDSSGQGAVAAISEMAVGRLLGGADDGQAGGNDSERCFSPVIEIVGATVDWMTAVSL